MGTNQLSLMENPILSKNRNYGINKLLDFLLDSGIISAWSHVTSGLISTKEISHILSNYSGTLEKYVTFYR